MKKVVVCSGMAAAAVAVLGLAGCGSGGGGSVSSTSSLQGNASVPPSQAAYLPQGNRFFAMLTRDFLGAPAQATAPGGNTPLSGATVSLETRLDHMPVGTTVTTNADGSFTITVPPGATDLEVVVTKTTAGDAIVVKAPVHDGQNNVVVDETSTVGAEVAEEEEADGADPEDAATDADAAKNSEQQDENQGHPAPNVHQSHHDSDDGAHHHADADVTGNLDEKLEGEVGHSHHHPAVRAAVMAALSYARTHPGFNAAAIQRSWVSALVNGPGTYSDAQVAAALVAAGVTSAGVTTILPAVQSIATSIGFQSTITAGNIPTGLVVLLLLKDVSTATAMDAAVSSLTGTTVTAQSGGGHSGDHGDH